MVPVHARTIGPYRVLEPMGRGGMGVVYRAEHLQTGAAAALKTVSVPHQAMLQSLRREIRALARLRHPGIVGILEEGLHEGLPWYAMELLEGTPLNRYWSDSTSRQEPFVERLVQREPATRAVQPLARSSEARSSEALDEPTKPGPGAHPETRRPREPPPPSGPRPVAAAGRLDLALRIVHQLCGPLGYLHGEGLVHRDLKPQNILIRPDGSPVLIDFGLLTSFTPVLGRDALELENLGAGTAAYMAPEQIRAEICDARTDLYSVGCILYEMVGGRRPFAGETDAEVMAAHLSQRPTAISKVAEGVPADLDELLQRLLAKDPRQRLGHAADLAAALERLGISPRPHSGPKARAYLYRPSFSGRNQELELLRQLLRRLGGATHGIAPFLGDAARPGSGGLVFVGGNSGIGKTRLALELAREAELAGIEVLTGECLPPEHPGGRAALGPLRRPLQRLADRCREHGLAECRRVFGARGRLLAAYEPALSALPGFAEHPPPAELPPDAARLRLYHMLLQVFEAVAATDSGPAAAGASSRPPLLLVLDDLQWADGLTLGFLELLLRYPPMAGAQQDVPALRLMLLGLYRVEEAGEPLRALLRSPQALNIELGPLDPAAVGTMIAEMLALPQPPAQFSRFVDRQARGNPFLVAEYLRAAVDEGADGRLPLLWRDERGVWQVAEPDLRRAQEQDYAALAVSASLSELVGRRLRGLPPAARAVADAAAVAGSEAGIPILGQISGLSEADLHDGLNELLRRQVLERSGTGAFRFTHDKLREGAYERIERELRPGLHRSAAEAIERLFAAEREQRLAELGHHWEQGGSPGRARECYLASGRRAAERYANEEAERLYRAYLRLADTPAKETVEARNELGEKILLLRGHNDEALAEHGKAAAEARRLGDRGLEAESLLALGRVHWKTGQMELARQLYEQALDLFRQVGDRVKEGMAVSHLGGLHYDQGRLDEARSLSERALGIACEAGDRSLKGSVLGNLGILHIDQGRLEEALPLLEQALAVHRETGDRRSEGNVLGNLGVLHNRRGQLNEARQLFEQELAIDREVGDRRFEGKSLGNLGELCLEMGRIEEARQLNEQALAIHREVGNRRFEGIVLGCLARLRRVAGEEQAAGQIEQSQALLEAVGDKGELGKVLCERGHLELANKEPPGSARACLERAQALAQETAAVPDSVLGEAISKLLPAVEAFEAGEHHRLVRGELVENLPKGLRHWLEQSGQLAAGRGQ